MLYVDDFYFYDSIENKKDFPRHDYSAHFFGETRLAVIEFTPERCHFLNENLIPYVVTNPYRTSGNVAPFVVFDDDEGELNYGIKQLVVTQKSIESKLTFAPKMQM